jgi:hypothetical protein
MYHCDEARPQLRRSSTFVVNTFSGNWFSSDVKSSLIPAMTVPRWSEAGRSDIVDVSQCSILEGEDDAPLLIALTLR